MTRRENESPFALPSIDAKLRERSGTMECVGGTSLLRAPFRFSQFTDTPPRLNAGNEWTRQVTFAPASGSIG